MTTNDVSPAHGEIRARFPALAGSTVFLENAGGSQVPAVVADAMHAYLRETYVQLGAPYALSRHCTRIVERAHDDVRVLMNATGAGEVVIGHSSSGLLRMLADAYAETIRPGEEDPNHIKRMILDDDQPPAARGG